MKYVITVHFWNKLFLNVNAAADQLYTSKKKKKGKVSQQFFIVMHRYHFLTKQVEYERWRFDTDQYRY